MTVKVSTPPLLGTAREDAAGGAVVFTPPYQIATASARGLIVRFAEQAADVPAGLLSQPVNLTRDRCECVGLGARMALLSTPLHDAAALIEMACLRACFFVRACRNGRVSSFTPTLVPQWRRTAAPLPTTASWQATLGHTGRQPTRHVHRQLLSRWRGRGRPQHLGRLPGGHPAYRRHPSHGHAVRVPHATGTGGSRLVAPCIDRLPASSASPPRSTRHKA